MCLEPESNQQPFTAVDSAQPTATPAKTLLHRFFRKEAVEDGVTIAVSTQIPRILSRFRVSNNSVSQLGPMVTGSERNHPLQQLPSAMATETSAKQDRPWNKTAPTRLSPCYSNSALSEA